MSGVDTEMAGAGAAPPGEDGGPVGDNSTAFAEFANEDARALLEALEHLTPAIPDEVTRAYLTRSGFETDDIRAQRLIALAAQKFIAEVVYSAAEHAKSRNPTNVPQGQQRKLTLQVDDVHYALRQAGIAGSVPPPQYYADRSGQ